MTSLSKMAPTLYCLILDAIEEAKKQPKTREMSLVLTKLEEAFHWYGAQKPVEGLGNSGPPIKQG